MYDTYRELAEQNLHALPDGDADADTLTVDRGRAWATAAIHEPAQAQDRP